jgi:hypothetical protein
MFEYHNNILCIQGGWLIEVGVLTTCLYKQLTHRKHLLIERRGGNGRTALIQFDTMRQDIKQKVIELTGNPYELHKNRAFIESIVRDQEAIKFFNSFRYTLQNELTALPEETKEQYVIEASIFNAIDLWVQTRKGQLKIMGGSQKNIWDKVTEIVSSLPLSEYPHKLPLSSRKLSDKFKAYKKDGYQILIHKNFGNVNSEKINENMKVWALSRWADQVNRCTTFTQLLLEYNQVASKKGYSTLKSEETLRNYLDKHEHLWYASRMGELKAKERFSYAHKTALPAVRDSLWYSDGTKMNLYYLDDNGKMATCYVYEVMDAYSECFLGFHVSKSEDYEAQFMAYKMAIQVSGHKPYEIKFDNQGGHGKLKTGNYLNKIARIAVKTKPYNGKSKTIESAFGRFQQQVMAKKWFFTGQNITAKAEKSRANMEFILANVQNLPSLKEAIEAYKECREEWMSMCHPKTGVPRNEMYRNSVNPETPEISILEMVDLFWVEREKPIMVTSSGIEFTEKKERYSYMVNREDGLPDTKWLRENIDNKFVVKFNPDDMSMIYLYESDALGLRFVTEAYTKVVVQRSAQFQTPEGLSFVRQVQNQENEDRLSVSIYMDELQKQEGRQPEQHGLNTPHLKGIQNKRKTKKKQAEIGEYTKEISNIVPGDDDYEENIYSQF